MATSPPSEPVLPITLSRARHHLANAFALLAAEHDRQHVTALHLSALSGQDAGPLFTAVAEQVSEAQAAFQLLERFMWAAVGDEPALAVIGPMIDAARAKVRQP